MDNFVFRFCFFAVSWFFVLDFLKRKEKEKNHLLRQEFYCNFFLIQLSNNNSLAVVFVVLVGSVTDLKKEKEFQEILSN